MKKEGRNQTEGTHTPPRVCMRARRVGPLRAALFPLPICRRTPSRRNDGLCDARLSVPLLPSLRRYARRCGTPAARSCGGTCTQCLRRSVAFFVSCVGRPCVDSLCKKGISLVPNSRVGLGCACGLTPCFWNSSQLSDDCLWL